MRTERNCTLWNTDLSHNSAEHLDMLTTIFTLANKHTFQFSSLSSAEFDPTQSILQSATNASRYEVVCGLVLGLRTEIFSSLRDQAE